MYHKRPIISLFLWIGLCNLVYQWLPQQLHLTPSRAFLPALLLGAACILVRPPRRSWSPNILMALASSLYLMLRTGLAPAPQLWQAPDLLLVVAEVLALVLTLSLAHALSASLLMAAQGEAMGLPPALSTRVLLWEQACPAIATEFMRARRHERPLSLSIIGGISSLKHAAGHTRGQELTQDDLLRSVAEIIVASVRRIDLVIWQPEQQRFYVLCPETRVSAVGPMVARVQQEVMTYLGVRLQIGTAGFPEQAYTFEELVASAEGEERVFSGSEPLYSEPASIS